MALGTELGPKFLQLMKRYCVDYVNVGDQSVTRDLMVEDYLLRMGPHEVRGRDTAYFDATARQMTQYPNLQLTVHEIATSGERLMMRFSEHGRRAKDGKKCVWGGIGLYRWNGDVLLQCNVEQDYTSRHRQIASGIPDPVDHPEVAPWDGDPEPADQSVETVVRNWLNGGGLDITPNVLADDAWCNGGQVPIFDQQDIEVIDLFSVGNRVGFHVRQFGRALDNIGAIQKGGKASMFAIGIVHVAEGAVAKGRIIRNRMDIEPIAD